MSQNMTSSLFDTMDFGDDTPSVETRDLGSLAIFYATESGNARACAEYAQRQAREAGFKVSLFDMATTPVSSIREHSRVLFCVSTRSDDDGLGDRSKPGRAPIGAIPFWDAMNRMPGGSLAGVQFSVLALGDRSYADFCGFGKRLDARLEALGANRFLTRQDCDVSYGKDMKDWVTRCLGVLSSR